MNIKEKAKEFYKEHEDDIALFCSVFVATIVGYKIGEWDTGKRIARGLARTCDMSPGLKEQLIDATIKAKQFYGV